jgi:hypothetical protein
MVAQRVDPAAQSDRLSDVVASQLTTSMRSHHGNGIPSSKGNDELVGSIQGNAVNATPAWMKSDYLRFSDFSEPGIDDTGVAGIENPSGLCQDPKDDRQIAG